MDQNQFPQYNQFPQNEFPQDNFPKEKRRHGCVTAWLILMMVANSAVALIYLLASDLLMQNLPYNISKSMLYLLGFISAVNVFFAVMLWQYKRWGFYGFVGSAVAGFLINLQLGLGIGQSLSGLVGIGILFAVLQIKQDNVSAWEQMD